MIPPAALALISSAVVLAGVLAHCLHTRSKRRRLCRLPDRLRELNKRRKA